MLLSPTYVEQEQCIFKNQKLCYNINEGGSMLKKFNYKKLAADFRNEAEKNLPVDLEENCKDIFLNTIYKFSLITGEALSKDKNVNTPDDAKIMTQILSEWTFHKYIDLLRSDIPQRYHESILQKVGFTIYEMAVQSLKQHLSYDEICSLVEHHVHKSFDKACEGLVSNGVISKNECDTALAQSNINNLR